MFLENTFFEYTIILTFDEIFTSIYKNKNPHIFHLVCVL